MNNTTIPNKALLIFILGSLTTLGPLAIDLYLPAFPEIAEGFGISEEKVSLSLSSFFIGLAAGQLMYGPILERFGRKYPVYTGLAIFIIASLGCAMATSLPQLIIFRFFQAIGSCAGLVSARTIVRDLFDTKETARIFSLLIMVVAISPIFAPSMGAVINSFLGWPYIFIMLVVFALLVLWGVFAVLPHTKPPDRSAPLRPLKILKNYIRIISEPQFLIFSLVGAIPYGGLYAYLSTSSLLYQNIFAVSKQTYGLIFAGIATGLISASISNNFILIRSSPEKVITKALSIQMLIALAFTVYIFTAPINIYTVTLFTAGYMTCLGFVFPNASALSLKNMGHTAGNASALMGALQMIWGGIISAIVSLLLDNGVWPMCVAMAFCATIAVTLLIIGKRRNLGSETV